MFDGELVALDDAGRSQFERGCPTYVAFDLLMADGVDLRIQKGGYTPWRG